MKREFAPSRVDVHGFAERAESLSGEDPIDTYSRLSAELAAPAPGLTVAWAAAGENRDGAGGKPVPWLHVQADVAVPLVCQRCLAPVEIWLNVDRWFRFAPDEATAELEDEEADEDVLVAAHDFDLKSLIEDELLMEIPVTPRHEVCPEALSFSAVDEDFDAASDAKPNPFAVLGELRRRKPE